MRKIQPRENIFSKVLGLLSNKINRQQESFTIFSVVITSLVFSKNTQAQVQTYPRKEQLQQFWEWGIGFLQPPLLTVTLGVVLLVLVLLAWFHTKK